MILVVKYGSRLSGREAVQSSHSFMDNSKELATYSSETGEMSSSDSKCNQDTSTMNVECTPSRFLVEDPQTYANERTGSSCQRERRFAPFEWLGRITRVRPCLVLENSGSVARDHLAAERTFLAYARTSLALATMGVSTYHTWTQSFDNETYATSPALVQLLALTPTKIPNALERMGKVIGALTALLGMLIMLVGTYLMTGNVSLPLTLSLHTRCLEIFQHAELAYRRKIQTCGRHSISYQCWYRNFDSSH